MTKKRQIERNATGHILVVDDEKFIVDLIKVALVSHGYNVTTTNCGKKAFEIFQRKNFDMVITDILMPEGDGVYLTMNIERLNRNTPIIVMSGGGKLTPVNSAFGYVEAIPSVHKALKKPFCPLELCKIVNEILENESQVSF